MRCYRLGSLTKTDIKVYLVWIRKYRKKVLSGAVAIQTFDILRQITLEHELEIISRKIASDHLHLFITYHSMQNISKIVQWVKGISLRILLSEFVCLRKHFWGRHLWAHGNLAV